VIAVSRSLTAVGTALLGAGMIAASAAAPVQLAVPRLSDATIQLQASVLDIFMFPAVQQAIANEVEYAALWAAGLAESGQGVVQSVVALPQTLITATQQILTRDPLGALTTVEDAALAAGEAILVPVVASRIDIGQIQLAVDSALLLAQPVALVALGAGLFSAFDTVTRAVITAGQNFVNAVLSLNISNIINATVAGVSGVVASFGTAGQAAVDGIVAAQTTLATALAARPTPVPLASLRAAKPAAAVTAIDRSSSARESATAGTPAAKSTPRRAVARSVHSGIADAAAAAIKAPKRAASVGKHAAREAAAS
jgi:hypothetical protein